MDASRTDTLGKLLPKAIEEKRQRRKQRKQSADASSSLRTLSSDGTSISNMADEDDDRSINDDRSFGSFESGPDPERDAAAVTGATPQQAKKSSRASSRNASRTT